MSSIYKRGDTYYIRFKDETDRWVSRAAGTSKTEAQKILKAVERGVRDAPRTNEPPKPALPPSPPLRDLVSPWIERRRKLGLRTVDDDLSVLRNHVLPILGDTPVQELRVRHIRDLMDSLRAGSLAPRTVRHVYGTLHKLCADLVVDEVLTHSPCVLTKDQLPKLRDKDPDWRATAIFSRDEVELLLSSEAVPEDRRVVNALLFLTGVRFGELAGLRWRDLDERATPLPRLSVSRSYEHGTKTETPRMVPVHLALKLVLEAWRREGFERLMGRAPTTSDLIVPSREGAMRSRHQQRNKFLDDLKRLGLRPRRVHDTRRTMITLCRVDGARRDVLEQITHGARGNIVDAYTTLPWPTLCEAVGCLKLELLSAEDAEEKHRELLGHLTQAQNLEAPGTADERFVTDLVTATSARTAYVRKSWEQRRKPSQGNGGGAGSRTRVRKRSARTSTRHSR